jgi:hypothetical protein
LIRAGGGMCAVNLPEREQIQQWIRGQDCVSDVRVDIMRENILADKWLDEEI